MIETLGGLLLSAKSVSKPSITIESKEYRMINHFYSYPGLAKWEPISIVFVDIGYFEGNQPQAGTPAGEAPVESPETTTKKMSTSQTFWTMLLNMGYIPPDGSLGSAAGVGFVGLSPSKQGASENAIGLLLIHQLDSNGDKTETWELVNPIITKLRWGELSYDDDGAVELTMDIKYDYAILKDTSGTVNAQG